MIQSFWIMSSQILVGKIGFPENKATSAKTLSNSYIFTLFVAVVHDICGCQQALATVLKILLHTHLCCL